MSQPKVTEGLSRRGFAAVLAASGAAAPALLAQQSAPTPPRRSGPPPEVPPFQAPIEFARKDVPARVHPFPMTQVKLLPGPVRGCRRVEASHENFRALDDLRSLMQYQVTAKIASDPEQLERLIVKYYQAATEGIGEILGELQNDDSLN